MKVLSIIGNTIRRSISWIVFILFGLLALAILLFILAAYVIEKILNFVFIGIPALLFIIFALIAAYSIGVGASSKDKILKTTQRFKK